MPAEVLVPTSYGLILQGFNFDGMHYTLMQFAVDYGDAARKDTAFYVKCQRQNERSHEYRIYDG